MPSITIITFSRKSTFTPQWRYCANVSLQEIDKEGRLLTDVIDSCSYRSAPRMPAQPNLITFRRFWVNRLPTCEIRWTHSRGNFKTNKLFNTPTTSVLLKGICFLKIFTGSIASSPPKFLLMARSISGQRGSRPCSSAVLYTIFTKLKLNVRIEWFNRRLFYLNINVLILARDNLNIFNPV